MTTPTDLEPSEIADYLQTELPPSVSVADRRDPHVTDASQPSVTLSDIPETHGFDAVDTDGTGVTVIVMDSGIDPTHPVFDDTAIDEQHAADATGKDAPLEDDVGHGTAVAGLIAELAPGVTIVPVRIFGGSGSTSIATIAQAYYHVFSAAGAIDDPVVVNMSWGAQQTIPPIDWAQDHLASDTVRPVTAAGNTGGPGGSPATASESFGVGALTEDGDVTNFSSANNPGTAGLPGNPDIAALGKNVRLPRADGTSMGRPQNDEWTIASGTSFSAPEVSAAVAHYAQRYELEDAAPRLMERAEDVRRTARDGTGSLRLDRGIHAGTTTPTVQGRAWNLDDSGYELLGLASGQRELLPDGEYEVEIEQEPDGFHIHARLANRN